VVGASSAPWKLTKAMFWGAAWVLTSEPAAAMSAHEREAPNILRILRPIIRIGLLGGFGNTAFSEKQDDGAQNDESFVLIVTAL
jgi:hypothetical protein